jgi:ferredoxin
LVEAWVAAGLVAVTAEAAQVDACTSCHNRCNPCRCRIEQGQ